MSGPGAATDAVAEIRHAIQHRVYLGHDVLAVDDNRRTAGRAQGDVERGALLGEVDLLAAEHEVDSPAQLALLGQLQQVRQRFVGHALFGIVQIQPRPFGDQPLAAAGIVCEELTQVHVAKSLVVRRERPPRGLMLERRGLHDHGTSLTRGGGYGT